HLLVAHIIPPNRALEDLPAVRNAPWNPLVKQMESTCASCGLHDDPIHPWTSADEKDDAAGPGHALDNRRRALEMRSDGFQREDVNPLPHAEDISLIERIPQGSAVAEVNLRCEQK